MFVNIFANFRRISWQQRKRFIYLQIWCATAVMLILLPLTRGFLLFSSGQQPGLFWIALLIETFTWHFGLMAFFIFIPAMWKKKFFLAGCALLLVIWGNYSIISDLLPKLPAKTKGKPLQIMSVNLLARNRKTTSVIQKIIEVQPDVIVLQEYSPKWHRAFSRNFASQYPHAIYKVRTDSFGGAIYAKIPFIESTCRLSLGAGVPTFRVEVEHESQRWIIYNIHLLPPRRLDYVEIQQQQFAALYKALQVEKHPLLVCGDFNWTQHNWYHRRLKNLGLQEGHESCGHGTGNTWPTLGLLNYFPGIRIDHIYTGNGIICADHYTAAIAGSDHFALIAVIKRQVASDN